MNSVLLNAMAEKKIVSLYTDTSETNKFTVGYILGTSDDYVLLNSIATNGINDGLYLLQANDIFRINIDGEYENKILKLYHMQNQKPVANMQVDDLFNAFFTYAQKNAMIVSIKLCDGEEYELSGIVENVSDEQLTLKCISNYGKYDGISIVKNNYITKATCNSDFECTLNKILDIPEDE